MQRRHARSARRVLARVARQRREPVLAKAAREVLDGPQPVEYDPPLFQYAGWGLDVFGSRDVRDGMYVTTYCVSAFRIPVLPLRAYRVYHRDDGSRWFFERVRLGTLALWYRRFALAAVLALVAWIALRI